MNERKLFLLWYRYGLFQIVLDDVLHVKIYLFFYSGGSGGQHNSRCSAPWMQLDNPVRLQLRGRHDPACFAAFMPALPYEQAKTNCSNRFGNLAAMKEETARRFFVNLFNVNMVRNQRVYIGKKTTMFIQIDSQQKSKEFWFGHFLLIYYVFFNMWTQG